jgi:hypothetical protein
MPKDLATLGARVWLSLAPEIKNPLRHVAQRAKTLTAWQSPPAPKPTRNYANVEETPTRHIIKFYSYFHQSQT